MKQFQEICVFSGLSQRSNFGCVKFLIVCIFDAVSEFLFRKIGQESAHHFISDLRVRFSDQILKLYIKLRHAFRNI